MNVNVSWQRLHIFHSALHLNVLILMMQSESGNFTHRIGRGRKRNEDRLVEDSTKKIQLRRRGEHDRREAEIEDKL